MKNIKIISVPWLIQPNKNNFKKQIFDFVNYDKFENYSDFVNDTMFISFLVEGEADIGLLFLSEKKTWFSLIPKKTMEENFFYGSNSGKLTISHKKWNELVVESQKKQGKISYNFVF